LITLMPLTQAPQTYARIEAAGQAAATDIYKRLEAVMADFEIVNEKPMIRDQAIGNAAIDLARCDTERAKANTVVTTSQAHHARIMRQIEALEGERQAIVTRRAAGDKYATDGAKLAEMEADIESLRLMVGKSNLELSEARRAFDDRSAARQRAAVELSRAESAALAAARRARLDELAPLMLDLLAQDTAQRKQTHARPDWVAPPELLRELQLRAGQRPDLATGGMPGSRFPASAAYWPIHREV
jgi:hypothetical protein